MTDRSHYQEDMERLQRLRPIDDDFMRCMFRDNDSLFQMVIQIILQIDNIHMIKVETQKDLKAIGRCQIFVPGCIRDRLSRSYIRS